MCTQRGVTRLVRGPSYVSLSAPTRFLQLSPLTFDAHLIGLWGPLLSLNSVSVGAVGEIFVGGAGLALGYLGRPGLTAASFVADPFSAEPGARLFRSGDLGRRLADGDIAFVGRADGQVKLRGFRVETGEVEGVLAEHPDVAQCVVVVREVTPGDPRLVAYLTGGGRSPVSVAGLRAHAEKRLPEYMVPSVMTQLDRLPTTVNGKVDRARLPGPAQRDDRERGAGPAGPAPVSYPGRPEAPDGA
jgi:acyl-CoA synthetase (AMP-forming)/AMP-acid ligase II